MNGFFFLVTFVPLVFNYLYYVFNYSGLAGVADTADATKLFQADRIHPTEAAHPIILNNIWPELQKQLKTPTKTTAPAKK